MGDDLIPRYLRWRGWQRGPGQLKSHGNKFDDGSVRFLPSRSSSSDWKNNYLTVSVVLGTPPSICIPSKGVKPERLFCTNLMVLIQVLMVNSPPLQNLELQWLTSQISPPSKNIVGHKVLIRV